MTPVRGGTIPSVLLAVLVLLTVAAVGPAAGGVPTDRGRSVADGPRLSSGDQPTGTGFPADVLGEEPPALGWADHVSSPVVDPVSDRIASSSERVVATEWTPPAAVLLFGYTRKVDGAPLDNEVRSRVYDHVRSTPGAHIAAIADGTDVPRSTVRYHLRVLEDAELIDGATIRGRHRYARDGADLELAAALHDEPTRAVIEAVARFEPVSLTGLAEEIDRAPSTVAHHLDHLEDVGLLDRETSAGRTDVRLDGAARDLETDRRARIDGQGVRAELPVE